MTELLIHMTERGFKLLGFCKDVVLVDRGEGNVHRYVTWTWWKGDTFHGHYFGGFDEAVEDFVRRIK